MQGQLRSKIDGYLLSGMLCPFCLALSVSYSLWFCMLGTTSIWFKDIQHYREFTERSAGNRTLYRWRLIHRLPSFLYRLPVAFLTTVPARAMLGRVSLVGW